MLLARLLLVALLLAGLLGGLLLLLLVLVAGVPGQRLLQNLKNLLVLDLLVRLDLAQVKSRRGAQLGDAVLGDGWDEVSKPILGV